MKFQIHVLVTVMDHKIRYLTYDPMLVVPLGDGGWLPVP